MKQQQIEQIRQACIRIKPEIGDFYCNLCHSYLDRPTKITLEDILMAIEDKYLSGVTEVGHNKYLEIISDLLDGYYVTPDGGVDKDDKSWHLTKPLQDQSDECIEFINKILCQQN